MVKLQARNVTPKNDEVGKQAEYMLAL